MYASAELVVPRSIPIFIVQSLFDLDLGGREHIAGRGRGQIHFFGFPSFVPQRAAGGFAAGRNVADQLHGRRGSSVFV